MLAIQDHIRVWHLVLWIGVAGAACSPPDDNGRSESSPPTFDRSTAGFGALNGLGATGGTFAPGAAGAGVLAGTAPSSASQRRWPKAAITSPQAGSVTGKVFDAVSGSPIAAGGTVVTNSKCVGCDPTGLPTAVVKDGAFMFPVATQRLTLDPSSTFTISVPGYEAVTLAHGPSGATAVGGQMLTEIPPVYLCPIGAKHGDQDRICDAAEMRYGTNPNREDTDGDALSDAAEIYGVDGDEALDIRGLGVDPLRADVLLELDFMHGFAPSQAAVDAVVAAFNRAPSKSTLAQNKPGIGLHAWIDDELDGSGDIDVPSFTTAKSIVKNNFNLQSKWPTHYGVFARQLVDSRTNAPLANSGVSMSIAGSVFFVTLQPMANPPNRPMVDANLTMSYQAATLMHELGHNLGLQHGGGEDKNFKPNYLSVMNSLYQFDAVPKAFNDWKSPIALLDYSRFATPDLTENKLSEQKGLDAMWPPGTMAAAPLANPWSCGRFDLKLSTCMTWREMMGAVPGSLDFDGDSKISPTTIAQDLNGNGTTADTFRGASNDWEVLDFTGKPSDSIIASGAAVVDVCPAPPDGLGGVQAAMPAADGGVPDGGVKDGGISDAGVVDSGVKDAGTLDSGVKDAGIVDSGVIDSGIIDSGILGTAAPLYDAGIITSVPRVVTSSAPPPIRPPTTTSTAPRTTTVPKATMSTAARGAAGAAGKAAAGSGAAAARAGAGGAAGNAAIGGTGGFGVAGYGYSGSGAYAGYGGYGGYGSEVNGWGTAGYGGSGGDGGYGGYGGAAGSDALGDGGLSDAATGDPWASDAATDAGVDPSTTWDSGVTGENPWGTTDPWGTSANPDAGTGQTPPTSDPDPGAGSDPVWPDPGAGIDPGWPDPGWSDPGGGEDPGGWGDPGSGDEGE